MVVCLKCKCSLKNASLPDIMWVGLACPRCGSLHGKTAAGATVFDCYHSKYRRPGLSPHFTEVRQRKLEFDNYLKTAKPTFGEP